MTQPRQQFTSSAAIDRPITGIHALDARLARGEILILDGAMGTELEAHGVPMHEDAWCALANLDHPRIVGEVHDAFLRAGADVLIANTFASGLQALEAAGYADRFEAINRAGVELAVRARERSAAGRPVAVAGSISPMGAGAVTHLGPGDPAELLEGYRRQADILASAGADLIITEMIQSGRWHGPAVRAATETGLPTWLGVCVGAPDGDGRISALRFPEIAIEDVIRDLARLPISGVALMHSAVEDIEPAIIAVRRHWDGPVAAYPHHGHYEPPSWVPEDIAPGVLTAYASRWTELGVQILGGCCGIGPLQIAHLQETFSPRGTG